MQTYPCPANPECLQLTLRAGEITAHLVDDHAWTKVGAQAAENLTRSEATGPIRRPAGAAIVTTKKTYHCSACGHPGTRRDFCPNRAQHPGAAPAPERAPAPALEDDGRPAELDDEDRRPLFRVGRLIDRLRDSAAACEAAADELDALVAAGLIP